MPVFCRKVPLVFSLVIALVFFLSARPRAHDPQPIPDLTEQQQNKWLRFWDEHQGHKLVMKFSAEYRPATLAIIGVTVIPMTGGGALERQTVIVEAGRIVRIGPVSVIAPPKGANVITGYGRFMIPGLTEAHSHTQVSLSQFLVYLTRGVTTLREMDGFPWMLKARDRAMDGTLLIPNLYVAGHILSNRAWNFYMTQVDTETDARRIVRAQAAAGYDFIKIHNSMPEPLFSAIFEAANDAGLDVVGHIPGEILISQAIAAGMRTSEHFKGYLFDETLQITDQDYVADTEGSGMWHTPTFTAYHDHLRGEAASALAARENSLRLVPRWLRASWLRNAGQTLDPLTELRQTIYPKSREIFSSLWPVTDKFIAGTDTGTYAFLVPGYALQEEVRIFEDLGMSPFEALKTATVNAAEAFRKQDDFGTIEVGKRADFVILNSNPLAGSENLSDIWGVSARGIWLHKDALMRIEDSLEAAFSEDAEFPQPTRGVFEAWVGEMETLKREGFPYPDYSLEEIEIFLSALGHQDLATRIDALQANPGVAIQIPE